MMILHNHTKDFAGLIQLTAVHFGIFPDFVEKDYWITLCSKSWHCLQIQTVSSLREEHHYLKGTVW